MPQASLPASWLLGLTMAMLIVAVLAWQYSRTQLGRPGPRARVGGRPSSRADPTLEFIEHGDDH